MALKRITLGWIVAILLLAACSRGAGSPEAATQPSDLPVTAPPATPSPLPTATLPPTATPEPTPIVPAITVETPTLKEDGRLLLSSATIPTDGWLVIYREQNGAVGDLLGYARLVPGENAPITITIAPYDATPTLVAVLHEDAGTLGVFDPEADAPLKDGQETVSETFQIDIQLPLPAINVSEQTIASDRLVHIEGVFALEPGWVVVHSRENGEIGPAVGQAPVQAGQNDDLAFPIRWQNASTQLLAILYEDKEQPGGFDKESDLPVLNGGSPVVAEFDVTLPPDIFVYDQPLRDGTITVERAISNGPGWIAAYFDNEGQPGLIFGYAHLEDGVNELVEVELLESAATERLFLILHEDSGTLREFDFPAADQPVIYEGQPLAPFLVQTVPGNYLITADQPLGENNDVTVPLIIVDLDTWIVIYNLDEAGEANEIIGQTWVPAGINRDVQVKVDPDQSSALLIAMLHQDNAPLEQFDFPGGADIPLLRNLLPIQSPFKLEAPPEDNRSLP